MRMALLSLVWLVFVVPTGGAAQINSDSPEETVSVVAGPDYAAGGTWRFFWGDHYRDSWTAEIRVPVLKLREYAGGLTPISAGGGFQTKSLWLQGADGRPYAFRSVYKGVAKLVPELLRGTFVEDLAQDQMSGQHPVGAMLADSLLSAVGVMSTHPKLYVLPDDAALGEFRGDFANLLGLLELRPEETADRLAAFAGAQHVVGTFAILDELMGSPRVRVHSRAFLAARLMDLFLGDWDRHADQWRWADFGADSTPGWRPIALDRDQALSRLDGFIVGIGYKYFIALSSFGERYDRIVSLHYNARFLDRLFLTELERSVWDSAAASLAAALTDDVVDGAVDCLPPEMEATDGEFMRRALKSRRDLLPEAAGEFYELMASEPYVHATNAGELVELTGTSDGLVQVAIREAIPASEPYFLRVFRPEETNEIRVFLHGGDDRVVIEGGERLPILVRLIGGAGDDEFHFATSTGNVRLYDESGSNRVTGQIRPGINSRPYDEPPLIPPQGSEAPPRHWGNWGVPLGTMGYSPDYGFKIGASYVWFDYGFRKDPYASRVKLAGALATAEKGELQLETDFRFENSPFFVRFAGYGSDLGTLHFYGVGNDSELTEDAASDFYDVEHILIGGEASFGVALSSEVALGLGARLTYSNTKDDPDTFLGQTPDVYGAGKFGFTGAMLRFDVATSRRPGGIFVETEPRPGTWLRVEGSYTPALIDVDEDYGAVDAAGAVWLPLGLRRWEVALRAGGRKIWGDAPWFHYAFIGGDESLRGWPRERFAGDASLYGSAELRLDLFNYRLVFPSTFGIFGLVDGGRVWVDGESPGGWHSGYGGGIWLALRGTRNIVSVAYAESAEDSGLYINLGFSY
ncbi:MAG: hypothetical protein JSV86_17605 [Gemmatimonadota bacterium]|nr:MAG: hypothetical protein JSV86_17605 [Gemmatimonadota bacterium]